jgi:hypothetical protein
MESPLLASRSNVQFYIRSTAFDMNCPVLLVRGDAGCGEPRPWAIGEQSGSNRGAIGEDPASLRGRRAAS